MSSVEGAAFRLHESSANYQLVSEHPDMYSFTQGKRITPVPSLDPGLHIYQGAEQVNVYYDREKPTQFFRGLTLIGAIPHLEELSEVPFAEVIGGWADNARGNPSGAGTYTPKTLEEIFQLFAKVGFTDAAIYNENPLRRNTELDREGFKSVAEKVKNHFRLNISHGMQTFTHVEWIDDPQYQHIALNTKSFDHRKPQTKKFFATELIPDAANLLPNAKYINIGADELVEFGNMNTKRFIKDLTWISQEFAKYGVQVMLWADQLQYVPPEALKQFVDSVHPIFAYWDYATEDPDGLQEDLALLKQFGVPVYTFAGVQDWNRFDTLYEKGNVNTKTHAKAGRKAGVDGFFISSWGDGKSKHPLWGNIPAFVRHAEHAYNEHVDEGKVDAIVFFLTGEHADEFALAGKMDRMSPGDTHGPFPPNMAQVLLFQDELTHPFTGSVPTMRFTPKYDVAFQALSQTARKAPERTWPTRIRQAALADVLRVKPDVGIDAKRAYRAGDTDGLEATIPLIDTTHERVGILSQAHKNEWNNEKSPAGFADVEERYQRIQEQLIFMRDQRIIPYLNGKIKNILEFEQLVDLERADFLKRSYFYGDIISTK